MFIAYPLFVKGAFVKGFYYFIGSVSQPKNIIHAKINIKDAKGDKDHLTDANEIHL